MALKFHQEEFCKVFFSEHLKAVKFCNISFGSRANGKLVKDLYNMCVDLVSALKWLKKPSTSFVLLKKKQPDLCFSFRNWLNY